MRITLLLLLLSNVFLGISQTNSLINGNWNNGPSWNTGVTPPDNGDTVVIEAGDIISLNANTTYTSAMVIVVKGTLTINQTLTLPSGSQIVIEVGGMVNSGNNGWRLNIGAASWKDFKKDPHTSGILTDIALSTDNILFDVILKNDNDLHISWFMDQNVKEIDRIFIEYSLDSKHYNELNEIDSKEYVGEMILEEKANSYVVYYRLVVQYENEYSYSEVKKIINENYKYTVYPNPFTDEINMTSFLEKEGTEVKIMDMLGNEVFFMFSGYNTINLSHLESGIYFVNIYQEGVSVQRERLMKE